MTGSSETLSWLGASLRSCKVRLQAGLLLLTVLFVASPAQAAVLTLGCFGASTLVWTPKGGDALEPQKEDLADFSVVVDFEQRTVSGFWVDFDKSRNVVQRALPITAVDANTVNFQNSEKNKAGNRSVAGTVDRITGKVDASDETHYANGDHGYTTWDLRCKPTKRLF
jgi:hypothetical protein